MGRTIVRHQQRRLVHVGRNSLRGKQLSLLDQRYRQSRAVRRSGYSTAYRRHQRDDGGPLVACAVLRDFVVVLKKSGVYVIEDTGGPIFAERKVSDYYGCEWPDSVIVVNNIMYWISPTRNGEVVAFDGTQITPVSNSLASTSFDRSRYYRILNSSIPAGSSVEIEGGITAGDGENIVWNELPQQWAAFRMASPRSNHLHEHSYWSVWVFQPVCESTQTRLTCRLGFIPTLRNAILTVASTQIATGRTTFGRITDATSVSRRWHGRALQGARRSKGNQQFTVRFSG